MRYNTTDSLQPCDREKQVEEKFTSKQILFILNAGAPNDHSKVDTKQVTPRSAQIGKWQMKS